MSEAAAAGRPRAPHRDRRRLVAVALGGAIGAPVRYLLVEVVPRSSGGVPWGTLLVNVTGALAIGVIVVALSARPATPWWVLAVVVAGGLGAYTTFSTFVVETDQLVEHGHGGVAALSVALMLVLGIGAAGLGSAIGDRLRPRAVP